MDPVKYCDNAFEAQVHELRSRLGPRAAFGQLVAENDALIRSPQLENGHLLALARTAIHTVLIGEWAAARQRAFGYDRPFAVVAVGGTGRGEMAPASDVDIAFLFDDAIEDNHFLKDLQREALLGGFQTEHGFRFNPLPFNLDDMPSLEGKQLNSFLDMRPVYDPAGLADVFRERIRATFDPFEQFLHVKRFWEGQWEGAAARWDQVERFDLKHEGLRVFLAGIWALGSKRFLHSHEVYTSLLEDTRDLEAYHFLMRIRAFLHLRNAHRRERMPGADHSEDIVGFDDLTSFGSLLGAEADAQARFEFANEVRRRVLSARRRVGCFARGIIGRELKAGRPISAGSTIIYGTGGLFQQPTGQLRTEAEKSSAAFSLLLAAQHYSVPIDRSELMTTFRNAGDWLVLMPELADLFQEERGSLADSFQFLSQVEGAEDRLFPGYARFESSVDARVMTEKKHLRSVLEREKMRALERFLSDGNTRLEQQTRSQPASPQNEEVEVEAVRLDEAHLAAVRLALKTKRLPLTDDDLKARQDVLRPMHERFASGFSEIPLDRYYAPYSKGGFSPEILEITRFLVANRRVFKELSIDPNDENQVRAFVGLCGSKQRLRALYVFTRADRDGWESAATEPERWFLINELYGKAMATFEPPTDPARALAAAGFSTEEVPILQDLGADFHQGRYRRYANRFGEQLVRLAKDHQGTPTVKIFRDGFSLIIGVAARDYRGLAATITGAIWRADINLRQAHLFSARNYGLALDFFHIAGTSALPRQLAQTISDAILGRLYIADQDEPALPPLRGLATVREWRPGQFCLSFETVQDSGGLVYALAYRVFRHLGGVIFSLSAWAGRNVAFVSVYFSAPPEMSLEQTRTIVAQKFGLDSPDNARRG